MKTIHAAFPLLCAISLHLQLVRPVEANDGPSGSQHGLFGQSINPENRTSKLISAATWIPVKASNDVQPQTNNWAATPTNRREFIQELKVVGFNSTASNDTKSFAGQTAGSLLRPSFLTSLFRPRTSSLQQQAQSDGDSDQEASSSAGGDSDQTSPDGNSSSNGGDDEEEVTQTIVVPVNEAGEPTNGDSIDSSDLGDGAESVKTSSESLSSYGLDAAKLLRQHQKSLQQQQRYQKRKQEQKQLLTAAAMMSMLHRQQSTQPTSIASQLLQSGLQPKPAASLQLSKTEISSILNDREAPDFYRERELNGDGVVVGEEPESRLRAAASGDPYSSSSSVGGGGGLDLSGSSFGQLHGQHFGGLTESEFNGGQLNHGSSLLHAASDGGSFNHRFGSLGDGELGGGHSTGGRLMQSPNEFSNQISSHGFAGMGSYEGSAGNALDYNQAGLLRASSGAGDFGGPQDDYSGGAGFHHHNQASGGYHHQLDRHASELSSGFGSGEYHPGGSSGHEFPTGGGLHGGDPSGRLYAAGSHLGHSQGGSDIGAYGGNFNSYPGYHQTLGQSESSSMFNQQGAGGGGSPMSDEQALYENGFVASNRNDMMLRLGSSSNKLRPLSRIIPMASGKSQETSLLKTASETDQQRSINNQQVTGDSPKPTAEVHEALDDEAAAPGDEHDDDDDQDSSEDQQQQQQEQQQHQHQHQQDTGDDQANNLRQQSQQAAASYSPRVEFSRVNSAGYLGPKRLFVAASQKKLQQEEQQRRAQFAKKSTSSTSVRQSGRGDHYENPAHAGKYIID